MSPWKCQKGCVTKTGKPAWHTRKVDCPFERPEPPQPGRGAPEGGVPGPPPEARSAPEATGAQPAPEKGSALTFRDRAASTVAGGQNPESKAKPIENMDWLVPREHVSRFWKFVLGIAERMFNLVNKVVGLPPLPGEIMRVNPSDEVLLADLTQGAVTKLTKSMGAKTVEAAIKWIDTLAGLSIFGVMISGLVMFYWTELPKSPKIKAWLARRKEKAEERKRLAAEKAKGEPAGPAREQDRERGEAAGAVPG